MIKFSIKSDFSALRDFTKSFRTDIIENGLDSILITSLNDLKIDLKSYISKDIRNVQETQEESIRKDNINIAKSDEDIIKHLTSVDIKEINKTKNYKAAIENNVCPVIRDRKGDPVVRVKIPAGPSDTLESLFIRARNFFNESLFVIPNRDGSTSFKKNIGLDLTDFVKVVCSTDVGVTDKSNYRFKRTWEPKGYVEFALKQEAFKKLIDHPTDGLLDITPYVNLIKNKQFDLAKGALSSTVSVTKGKTADTFNTLYNKVEELELNKGPAELQDYYKITDLVDSLNIEKTIAESRVFYSVNANVNIDLEKIKDFQTTLLSKINLWVMNNEHSWFESFKQKIEQIIKKYVSLNE